MAIPSVVSGLLLLTGCGGTDSSNDANSYPASTTSATATPRTTAPPPPIAAFDPPRTFDEITSGPPSGLGVANILLAGPYAYSLAPDSLSAVNITDGSDTGLARPEDEQPQTAQGIGRATGAPSSIRIGTVTAAVGAFVTLPPATGTQVATMAVQALALDASTARTAWSASWPLPLTDLPDGFLDSGAGAPTAEVAGTDAGTVVVVVRSNGAPITYGVGIQDSKVHWKQKNFAAEHVEDGLAVGFSSESGSWRGGTDLAVTARDAASGDRRWAWDDFGGGEGARMSVFGPGRLLVERANDRDEREPEFLVTVAAGRRTAVPGSDAYFTTVGPCSFDERSATVCKASDTEGGWIAAYDTASARQLWKIPRTEASGGRALLEATGAWHGVVYGMTLQDAPITLDARTGRDLTTAPGAAPRLVNQYGAVAGGADQVTLFRATS
ncbi:hypothetical protein [Streptomyces sp. NBC_00572]|uniref:hypothetical protein n=1 Tax=Streptomyces sp. NBC_00572 TaxID=2903664 RepID=UPI0022574DA2|nr:hypothetical protein [Streptomyces sp. NBC_00572]MCX4985829.1 hypothetical protein [Streptomyces sp. NBC_00572]